MRRNSRETINYKREKESNNIGTKLAEQFTTQITLSIIILSVIYALVGLNIKQAIPILDMVKLNINNTISLDEIVENVGIMIDDINYKTKDTNKTEEPVILIDNEEF